MRQQANDIRIQVKHGTPNLYCVQQVELALMSGEIGTAGIASAQGAAFSKNRRIKYIITKDRRRNIASTRGFSRFCREHSYWNMLTQGFKNCQIASA